MFFRLAENIKKHRLFAPELEAKEVLQRRNQPNWALIRSRLSSLITSILLALFVWLYANSQENPLEVRVFPQRIPLTVRGLNPALQPMNDLASESVRLTVRAPRNAWNDLQADDFTAYIDLTGLTTGVNDVLVQVDFSNPQAEVLEIQQPSLRVQLDPFEQRIVPVRVQVMETTAFGYEWKDPLIEPLTVTISGPATQVEMVTEALAKVELRNAKSQVEKRQVVELVNRQNQVVTNVSAEPNEVRVVVPVEQWPGRKEVAVRLNMQGEPGYGYRLSTVKVEPPTVVLQGNNELLAAVPGFIETVPFTLTGVTTEKRTPLSLIVPPGLSVMDGNFVMATANIEPLEDSQTSKLRPVIQNIGDGLEAKIADDTTVDVILSGPLVLLNALNTDDVYAVLDLTGLVPGAHVVTPRVVLPEGLRAEGMLPQTVEVVITAKVEPTPSASQ